MYGSLSNIVAPNTNRLEAGTTNETCVAQAHLPSYSFPQSIQYPSFEINFRHDAEIRKKIWKQFQHNTMQNQGGSFFISK